MRIIFLALSLFLTGCVTSSQYGNFVDASSALLFNQKKIADDTVKQLVRLYPPAKTTLILKQTITGSDLFGQALVQDLRAKGYALLESHPQTVSDTNTPAGLPLRYTLAKTDTNSFTIMMVIGDKKLTRPYDLTHDGKTVATGYWVRKE